MNVAPADRRPGCNGARIGTAPPEGQRGEPPAAAEASFRKVVEHSEDVITMVDASGRVIDASPALERVLGFSAAETVGRLGFEFIHPEDISKTSRGSPTS